MLNSFEGVNFLNFVDKFNSNETCQTFIAQKKWEKGFVCRKCGHKHFIPIKNNFSKECSKCKYIESCTANTLFHKSKIGLRKAFHIIFEMSTFNQDVSSYDIAKRYDIQQKSAWSFMNKVRMSMQFDHNNHFGSKVIINDFVFGNNLNSKKNSSKSPNTCKIVSIIEHNENGKIKKIKAKIIENFSANAIENALNQFIDNEKQIITNTWQAYQKLKTKYNIEQKSKKNDIFKYIDKVIYNFFESYKKIHIRHSVKHFEKYLNQYCFKLNTTNNENFRFNQVFIAMMDHPPISWKLLTKN